MVATVTYIGKKTLGADLQGFSLSHGEQSTLANSNLIDLESKRKENQEQITRKSRLTSYLYQALSKERLEVYYQPQIDLKTGRIIGTEALLRWNHSELGFVSPEEFIPLAEKHGLIQPLTEWVLRQACLQTKQWSKLTATPLRISVNLSPYQLQYPDLAERISKILTEVNFNPNLLTLELVETTHIQDFNQAKNIFKKLQNLGISVVLDDFGTGYASLTYLQNLPFDGIKIDKSFITSVYENPRTIAIVEGMIAIAKALNLKVTAEGVETQADLDFITQKYCDFAQGYFFSKPVNHSQFTNLISEFYGLKCA
jgi:EAL domain-containing protein (putative c-di-GMP-specific phosphodiesterase class I)